jgi:hypothetical protein
MSSGHRAGWLGDETSRQQPCRPARADAAGLGTRLPLIDRQLRPYAAPQVAVMQTELSALQPVLAEKSAATEKLLQQVSPKAHTRSMRRQQPCLHISHITYAVQMADGKQSYSRQQIHLPPPPPHTMLGVQRAG